MTRLVIAASPDLVSADEHAFVEHLLRPTGAWVTYSSLLSSDDCRRIDERAYREGRSWFLTEDGHDPTDANGISLGRAFEHVATTILIRIRRASTVLMRLAEEIEPSEVDLRGMSAEWEVAAATAGFPVRPSIGPTGPIPGSRPDRPAAYMRIAGRLLSAAATDSEVAVTAARAWMGPHGRELARRWRLAAVDPGARFLAYMLRRATPMDVRWFSEANRGGYTAIDPSQDGALRLLARLYELHRPGMQGAVDLGQTLSRTVKAAVTTQDSLPPARALMLALRANGVGTLTMEHGLGGSFLDQIQPVSEVLGAWGEPHRSYHRELRSPGVSVEIIGWSRLEALLPVAHRNRDFDVVLFAQPTQDLSAGSWPEDKLGAIDLAERYAAANPSRRVAVKLHPSSPAFGWADAKLTHCQLVGGDSLDILRRTCIAMTAASTTAIEAMVLGVPVVEIKDSGNLGGRDLVAESGCAQVADLSAVTEVVNGLLTDGYAYRAAAYSGLEYAKRFIHGLGTPGFASAATASVIQRLIDHR